MRISSKNPALPRNDGSRGEAGVGDATTGTALGGLRDRGAPITACRGPSFARGLAAAAALALVAGCNPYVQGNGVYAEEDRTGTVGEFAGLQIESGDIRGGDRLSAVVTSGEARSVRVTGDANLVREIVTEVESEFVGTTTIQVLHVRISLEDQYDPTIGLQVAISIPSFSFVRAEGASTVQVKRAGAPVFTVDASGSSSVTVTGAEGHIGDLIDATLANDTLLDATNYPTARARVDLSGKGTAKLHSNGPVTGTAANDSLLDNLLGTGDCNGVVVSGSATKLCN
jgi:hypothetical protein